MPKKSKLPPHPSDSLKPSFFYKLNKMCQRLGINTEDVLLIMFQESGLNPAEGNNNYVGLVQLSKDYMDDVGFEGDKEDFRKLSADNQLDYIENFFSKSLSGVQVTAPAQLYIISTLLPVTKNWEGVLNKDRNTVLAEKGSNKTYVEGGGLTFDKVYRGNYGLDYNNDDKITYGDIEDFLENKKKDSVFQRVLSRYKNSLSQPSKLKKKVKKHLAELDYPTLDLNLDEVITNLESSLPMSAVAKLETNQQLFKKSLFEYLPVNNILVKINSEKLEDNLEFARIFSSACEELASAECSTHIKNNNVEVECKIPGKISFSFPAIEELAAIIQKNFIKQTNINLNLNLIANKKSSYQEIDIKTAVKNYKKFYIKKIGI